MFLILPDSLNPGIQSMEANMTTDTIKALMTTLQVTSVYYQFFFFPTLFILGKWKNQNLFVRVKMSILTYLG